MLMPSPLYFLRYPLPPKTHLLNCAYVVHKLGRFEARNQSECGVT